MSDNGVHTEAEGGIEWTRRRTFNRLAVQARNYLERYDLPTVVADGVGVAVSVGLAVDILRELADMAPPDVAS